MNPQDPLAELQPLREPGLIGWWPPAPGWWLLLALFILALAGISWLLWRRYQANAYRRRALRQLERLRTTYLEDHDSKRYVSASNALLKSVALRAYPADRVASRSGDDWAAFLDSTVAGGCEFPGTMASALYQRAAPEIDLDRMYNCAVTWIRKHEVAL